MDMCGRGRPHDSRSGDRRYTDLRQETALIEVKNAKKWIQNGARRVEILRGISLDIPAGQFVAIVGASGSGKSTLLGLLAGLDTPSEGEIWLDGVPIHNLAEAELARVRGRKIGFVFQSYQLTIPCSSPAASSSAWRWHGPLWSSRPW